MHKINLINGCYKMIMMLNLQAVTEDSSSVQSDPSQSITLFKCLDLFTKEEMLGTDDVWVCSNCKVPGKATRKYNIWKLPAVLMIHLTRLTHTSRAELWLYADCTLYNYSTV